MGLYISPDVRCKILKRHGVVEDEIIQCFANRTRGDLLDTRLHNKTDPPTRWFISQTDKGRTLKVVYIYDGKDIIIKTAFHPTDNSESIYYKHSSLT